jgi:hypothetical protein
LVAPSYTLYDEVEMKKEHPCSSHSRLFQIVRLGADVKIRCLGCGNVILMDRSAFNDKIKRIVAHHEGPLKVEGQK